MDSQRAIDGGAMNTTATALTVTDFSTNTREWGYYSGTGAYRRYYTNRRQSDRPDGHSIAYVNVQNENLLEDLMNRTSRPYNIWKQAAKDALRANGIEFKSLRWSQKAGCSCPCSPGFIIQGGPRGLNVHITLSADAPKAVDGPAREARAAVLGLAR